MAQNAEEDESRSGADVVRADVLHAGEDVVADGLHLPPLQYLRTEAIVGEAFRGVDQGVFGQLQANVDCLDVRAVCSGSFVGVELDSPVLLLVVH